MSVQVASVFAHATLQPSPVHGLRKFGVAPGGPFDSAAAARLNISLGNPPDAAVLEVALGTIALRARQVSVLAWSGDVVASVNGVRLEPSRWWLEFSPGAVLEFAVPRMGARFWVAAQGGFVMHAGSPIRSGDVLEIHAVTVMEKPVGAAPTAASRGTYLRAMSGRPEFSRLFDNCYTVRHDSDRVGIRLEGPRMAHRFEQASEPAAPGVVQVTPEGLPIILGPDGPTIGGYPRAAVVIAADIGRLAQLRPGSQVRFEKVTRDEAVAAWAEPRAR